MTTPHTLESLLELAKTPEGLEKIRVLVAELCGWQKVILPNSRYECGSHGCREETHVEWRLPKAGYYPTQHEHETPCVPRYTTSLDAMAEAEETLNWSEKAKYYSLLYKMAVGGDAPLYQFEVIHTKAPRRAIAFILTKQKP